MITNRVELALGSDLLASIQNHRITILGCGGVGAHVAEGLVRTGAKNLTLVDHDKVEKSNLNRFFLRKDICKFKVEALSAFLNEIEDDLNINIHSSPFKGILLHGDSHQKEIHEAIKQSDTVIIAMDSNQSRIEAENLLPGCNFINVGVRIGSITDYEYEICWGRITPTERSNDKGYGTYNASICSIVQEAASAAVTMLLVNLHNISTGEDLQRSRNCIFKNGQFKDIIST